MKLHKHDTEPPEIPALMTPNEVGRALRMTAQNVRCMIRSGKLQGVKLGGRSYRIPRSAVVELLEGGVK